MKRFHCPSDKTWSWTLHLKQSVQVCVCSQLFPQHLLRTGRSWTLYNSCDQQIKYHLDILGIPFHRYEGVDPQLQICSDLLKRNCLDECVYVSTLLFSFLQVFSQTHGAHYLLVCYVINVIMGTKCRPLPFNKQHILILVCHNLAPWVPCKEWMVLDEENSQNSLKPLIISHQWMYSRHWCTRQTLMPEN